MKTRRGRRRVALAATAALLLPPLGYVGWEMHTHNFGTLEPGRVYRSGQMPPGDLSAAVRAKRVKTVLNLRGSNPKQGWYRAERDAATRAGATLVDVSMSSSEWMSRVQLRTLVKVLDTCEYPLLIHCQWGAERTGWASAVATLIRPGATLDDARRQFSIGYLFVRAGDGKVMAEHLDQYEAWLRARGQTHSPGRFREWADRGFRPGKPSREDWPYDPYPLVVTTPPADSATR